MAVRDGSRCSVELAGDLSEVARARARTREQLQEWRLGDLAVTAELVVSELVTNALRHGTGPVWMVLHYDGALRIEVGDASHEPPLLVPPHLDGTSGRGLALVDALAAKWGTQHHSAGKTVWAEIVLD